MPSFRRTLLLNSLVPFAAMVLLACLLAGLAWSVKRDNDWVTHTLVVQRQGNLVDALLSQMEAGQRGYLITGQRSFLMPYLQGRGELASALKTLEYLVRDNPSQVAAAQRIHGLVTDWQANAEYEIRLKETSSPRFLPYFTEGKGASTMIELRDRVEAFVAAETTLLERREARLNRTTFGAALMGLTGVILAALFFGLFSLRQMRQLTATFESSLATEQAVTRELEEANRRQDLILDSSGEGIYGVDLEGRLTFINRTGLDLIGYREEEVMCQRMHALTHHTHADGSPYPREQCPIYDAFKDGHSHHITHEVFWRKDGTSFPVDYVSTPILQDGQVIGAVVNFRDLTSKLEQEAEHTNLLKKEKATRAELTAAKELDRVKDSFVNAVSHELRNPLTAILGYTEFLDEGVGGELTPTQASYVKHIKSGTLRLERLVNDLLDYARLEAGTFKLQFGRADLNETINEIVASLAPQATEARIRIETVLPEAPVLVRMDRQRITQVLANLIGNSLKFVPAGGTIFVRACLEDLHVRCEVEDTGEGIDPRDIPKLFKRFSQLESGVRKGGGTGLGLSISKAIVEAHGGEIGVEGGRAKGALFWFNLPLEPVGRKEDEPEAA